MDTILQKALKRKNLLFNSSTYLSVRDQEDQIKMGLSPAGYAVYLNWREQYWIGRFGSRHAKVNFDIIHSLKENESSLKKIISLQ